MADRKVLVKYYPPDFDFDKLRANKKALRIQQQQLKRRRGDVYDPPQKKNKNKIMNVRMMFPFTLKCGTCNEFIYVGTKFNSRVEKVEVSFLYRRAFIASHRFIDTARVQRVSSKHVVMAWRAA